MSRYYKLLKDTPTVKAGTIFEEVASDSDGERELAQITPLGAKTNLQWAIQDIDNFGEWFEETQEELIDSVHWEPKYGKRYWFIDYDGNIVDDIWVDKPADFRRHMLGGTYLTKEETEKACGRKLAEVTLRRSSTFKPDFENGTGGWCVAYDHLSCRLIAEATRYTNCGQIVWFKTYEDARDSIKKHKKEWLTYFGIKGGE